MRGEAPGQDQLASAAIGLTRLLEWCWGIVPRASRQRHVPHHSSFPAPCIPLACCTAWACAAVAMRGKLDVSRPPSRQGAQGRVVILAGSASDDDDAPGAAGTMAPPRHHADTPPILHQDTRGGGVGDKRLVPGGGNGLLLAVPTSVMGGGGWSKGVPPPPQHEAS